MSLFCTHPEHLATNSTCAPAADTVAFTVKVTDHEAETLTPGDLADKVAAAAKAATPPGRRIIRYTQTLLERHQFGVQVLQVRAAVEDDPTQGPLVWEGDQA